MKLNGFPSPMKGIVDCSKMAVVHFSKLFQGVLVCRIELANLEDRFWSEFLRFSKDHASSFFEHIVRVVFMRSKKKVIGINAMTHIAPMANQNSFRDRTLMNDPGLPVRLNHLSCSWEVKSSSSVMVLNSCPKPASRHFRSGDVLKESVFDIDGLPFPFEMAWRTARAMFLNHRRAIKALFSEIIHLDTSVLFSILKENCYGN